MILDDLETESILPFGSTDRHSSGISNYAISYYK